MQPQPYHEIVTISAMIYMGNVLEYEVRLVFGFDYNSIYLDDTSKSIELLWYYKQSWITICGYWIVKGK